MNTSRWFATDWSKVFALTTPILEIVVRGSLSYLILFFIMRIVLKCEAGTIGISDLLSRGNSPGSIAPDSRPHRTV